MNSDLILLPIFLRSYRYRDRLYRTLINGQTGEIVGEKPISTGRIALVVGLAVVLLIVAAILVHFAGSGAGR